MTHQKVCPKCKELKLLSQFYKNKSNRDGLQAYCKCCVKIEVVRYNRTIPGLVTTIYAGQRKRSKERGMNLPNYSNLDLKSWIINQVNFNELYCNWIESDYKTELKPSVDRIDNYKSYSFDNIQLMTWGENNNKGHRDTRIGVNKKKLKAVISYNDKTKDTTEYYSAAEAARQTGLHGGSITQCCRGKLKTTGGFMWRYV